MKWRRHKSKTGKVRKSKKMNYLDYAIIYTKKREGKVKIKTNGNRLVGPPIAQLKCGNTTIKQENVEAT